MIEMLDNRIAFTHSATHISVLTTMYSKKAKLKYKMATRLNEFEILSAQLKNTKRHPDSKNKPNYAAFSETDKSLPTQKHS